MSRASHNNQYVSPWSEEEIKIVGENHGKLTDKDLAQHLLNRTVMAIRCKRRKLGLHRKNRNRKLKLIKNCTKCGIELTSDNCTINRLKHSRYICETCRALSDKKYRETHTDKITMHRRVNYLRFEGRMVRVKKRDYPINNKCEICGRPSKRLAYHHWDDKELRLGIWVCYPICHYFVERVDKGYVVIYEELKRQVERLFPSICIS